LIRNRFYGSENYDGIETLRFKDERSFIIEALLNVPILNNAKNQKWYWAI